MGQLIRGFESHPLRHYNLNFFNITAILFTGINSFDEALLSELETFLNFEDEIILNFYNHNINKKKIYENKISKIFKNFKI